MGKTALVTGASSGIGLELARVLAREGYDLVLVARSVDRLSALSAELQERCGIEARTVPADLSRPGAAQEVYERTGDLQIEVLVNNAGFGMSGEFAESDWATVEGLLQVNVGALTELTRLYLPAMKRRGSGHILNVSSTAAFLPCPTMAVYGAAKAYVLSFTEALAFELRGSGVTATVLCPGATRTAWADRAGVREAPMFQQGVMEAATVAVVGYAGTRAGRTLIIPGMRNRVMVGLGKLSPQSMLARISQSMLSPAK